MLPLSEEETPKFETLQDELKYWKENFRELSIKYQNLTLAHSELEKKYEALNDEYQRLLACHTCVKKEETEPSKDEKSEKPQSSQVSQEEPEDSMDPLKKLDEPIAHKIMQYLSGKELLIAMEVSKRWKQFIETRNSLMNRAMNKVVVKPNLRNCMLSLINGVFNKENQKRPYKHMKAPIVMKTRFVCDKKVHPIHYHATTLESLEINECSCDRSDENEENDCTCFDRSFDHESFNEIDGCEFPKLKILKYRGLEFNKFLKKFSFPCVTHLEIEHEVYDENNVDFNSMRETLEKFPKLECLNVCGYDFVSADQEDPRSVTIEEIQQPNIKEIYLNEYFGIFLKDQQNSLEVLELGIVDLKQLSWLLRDLKVLRSLTIGSIELKGEENFQPNSSIEILKFQDYKFEDYQERSNYQQILTQGRGIFRLFLPSLPSLKELVLGDKIETEMIQFIASIMPDLKTLTCKETTDEAMLAYQEIQINPHLHLNPCFEIIVDSNYNFKEIEKEFHVFK